MGGGRAPYCERGEGGVETAVSPHDGISLDVFSVEAGHLGIRLRAALFS